MKGDEAIDCGPCGKWLGKREEEGRKELLYEKKTLSVAAERQNKWD